MVVENSTRRLRAYGVRRHRRSWYLDRGSGRLTRGPALMLDELHRRACAATTTVRPCSAPPAAAVTAVMLRRGELAELADGYAVALHRQGLAAGDTVGLAVRPAAARAGG